MDVVKRRNYCNFVANFTPKSLKGDLEHDRPWLTTNI